jgi:thiamine kinase-like enzyme
MIPQEKIEAVNRGLSEAFGVTSYDDISPITTGQTTSLVFRILVQGTPYLLKLILRSDDPTRHFTCMNAAAEAEVAPRIRYTSIEDSLLITDFVEAVPFAQTEALLHMPRLLRTLHALPPFPPVPDPINTSCMFLLNKGPALEGFLQEFHAANVLSQTARDELFGIYAQLASAYRRDPSDFVSSHNDMFKPDNILFDGHRPWLVDWEAAFLNDRYVDLAVVANLVVANEAEEALYLREYFGHPPDEYQRARFFLMQQLVHVFYAMAFLWLGSPTSDQAPDFHLFQKRFWAGEIDLRDKQMKTIYGRVHWERLLHNVSQPRFVEALRIVSSRLRS